jgi:hypothetical protein
MKTVIVSIMLSLLSARVFATNYYVSGTGNDINNGLTPTSAFRKIQRAANATQPGDTVFVMNGTYTNDCSGCMVANITRSGTASAWIVFVNFPGHTPLLQFNGWGGLTIKDGARYIEISGLTIRGNNANVRLDSALNQPGGCRDTSGTPDPRYNGNGIIIEGRSAQSSGHPHHIRVRNNTIYECGSGVVAIQADYITIEKNIIYNNCWYTIYGTSGISLYQNWNYDNDTTSYRMVIRANRCFGNRLFVPWIGGPCRITDGNGIIIDDGKNTQNGSTLGAYRGKTLVVNNLCYGNGGSGIHTYESERVDIVNNTTYFNQQSPEIDGGEIFANASNQVLVRNNICYPRQGKPVNTNFNNTAIRYDHNLFFGGTIAVSGTNTVLSNPRFQSPSLSATADFRLQPNSPAIDSGSSQLAPLTDFNGVSRPQGNGFDMGAFEYAGVSYTPLSEKQTAFQLIQNYPNPFNPSTEIKYQVSGISDVRLEVFDVLGRSVATLVNERQIAGAYQVNFNAATLASGTYFYRLEARPRDGQAGFIDTKKMMLVK